MANFSDYTNLTSIITAIKNKLDKKVNYELVSQAEYDALVQADEDDPNVDYHIYDARPVSGVTMSDSVTSLNSVWSSKKTSDSIKECMSFSTDEQMVGTWIDGKPLYQKTFDCGTLPPPSSGTICILNIPMQISDVSMFTNVYGIATKLTTDTSSFTTHEYVQIGSDNASKDITISVKLSQDYFKATGTQSTTMKLTATQSTYEGYNCYVTVQYTKSTDE